VRHAPLKGIHIPETQVPLAIDEFPALFVAAACAEGETVLTGAEELRVKESDRIQVMADGLRALGVACEPRPDGIRIQGGGIGGGAVDSHGDHRIAMAFAMAGLRAEGAVAIADCANVNTSFPGFAALAGRCGLAIEEQGR
jgi:3-phosphoshikimate 1-carboxyvinyltransferase